MASAHELKSGETLSVAELRPGKGRGDTSENREVWEFIGRPFDPWMTPAEAEFVARFLRGATDGTLYDYFFVGRIGATVVGTAWHGTSRTHEIGGYGCVLTDAAHRGKGVAQVLTGLSVGRFWDDGGQAIYLGTGNPVARHVYEKSGYRQYNGICMRAVRPGLDPEAFDATYFAYDGPARTRDVHLGDLGGYTALLMARESTGWVVRDFTEAMFYAPPTVEATGSLRPFYNTLLRHESNPANQFKALVTGRDRMVAAAALAAPPAGALRGGATLEFQFCPAYSTDLATLLQETLEAATAQGIRAVRAYAVSEDRRAALRDVGFTPEAVARGLLDLGECRTDVHVLRRDLA